MRILYCLQLGMAVLVGSCSVSEKKLAGIYVDKSLGDTLEIKPDKTYEYNEKLINGKMGWTHGVWNKKKNKIYFTIDPRPLMGYRQKIIKDSSTDRPIFKLFLGDSEQPIKIESINTFFKGEKVFVKNIYTRDNLLRVGYTEVDSIQLITRDFLQITIGHALFSNYLYDVKIFPLERYYELDRYGFQYSKNRIININKPGLPNVYINFTKE